MTNANSVQPALDGLKIVELAEGISMPYCGKLLADLGAEVIKIERPRVGDPARAMEPFYHDEPSADSSLIFNFLNTNKLGVSLDVDTPAGRELLERLVGDADVLLVGGRPEELRQRNLLFEAWRERFPRLVVIYLTPFGLTGPYADRKNSDLIGQQMSGMGVGTPRSRFGPPDQRPLAIGGNQALMGAGLNAAVATMHALFTRDASGRGQMVDISELEPMTSYQFLNVARWVYTHDSGARGFGEGARKFWCKDGAVSVLIFVGQPRQWEAFQELMGNPEWAKDPDLVPPIENAEKRDRFWAHVNEWAGQYTREEVYRKAQALRIALFPVNTVPDTIESDQLKSRGFMKDMQLANGATVSGPSAPYIFSETQPSFRRSAPTLGRDNHEVLCTRLGLSEEELQYGYEAGFI